MLQYELGFFGGENYNHSSMKTSFLVLVAVMAVGPLVALAADKADPIDAALKRDMDRDPSTDGMIQATAEAEKKWDAAMNAAYSKLKKVMGREEWAALEASQKAWVVFRDKEFATQIAIFNRMEGSMWRVDAENERMELVKARALVLRGYLENISERD